MVILAAVESLSLPHDLMAGYRATLAATVLAGIIQVVLGLSRAGRLSSFFPSSAVHGLLASIGIILVTSRDDDVDKIVGLEVGADDYVTKPFNPRELLARVKSPLRRSAARPAEVADSLRFSGWVLELSRRRLRDRAGQDVALTRGEFEVLALLVRHPGEILDRDRLSRAVSGHDWSPQDRSVDVLVRRLRVKLDDPARADSLIATIRGEGYRLAVDVEPGGS